MACDSSVAYCEEGTCHALKTVGDACTDDAECGADSWCRPLEDAGGSECAVFVTSGDACGDRERCESGLGCNADGVCASHISICDVDSELMP